MAILLPIILSALIGIAHNASDKVCLMCYRLKEYVVSLIAGIATAYLFMNLYPEFYEEARFVSPFIFTSVFLGFSIFFLIDKEIYQKIKHINIPKDIRLAHGYGLTLYYFVVGIALVKLLNINIKDGILFFIPVFIYTALSTMSSHAIHGMHGPHQKTAAHMNFIQSLSVIIGSLIALFFVIPDFVLLYLIGLVAGLLTYIVIRDILPKGKQGRPLFFIVGAIIYLVLIIYLWYV